LGRVEPGGAGQGGEPEGADPRVGSPLRLVPTTSRRRPLLAALAALVVVASSAVVAEAFVRAQGTERVLEVRRTVPVGEPLQAADLAAVAVRVPRAVRVVPVGAAGTVLGVPAAATLVPGTLLTWGQLGTAVGVPSGMALVGVALSPAQAPADGVARGERVGVVVTGAPGGAGVPGQSIVSSGGQGSVPGGVVAVPGAVVCRDARVVAVAGQTSSSDGTSSVATLEVPASVAPVLAALSAQGALAVVVEARG